MAQLNLTPHPIYLYCHGQSEPITIPSHGELRLKLASLPPSTAMPAVFHYNMATTASAVVPVVPAQVFIGLDETSPGFRHLKTLKRGDAIIVSMQVARYIAAEGICPADVYSPATSPDYAVVSDDSNTWNGTRALEWHQVKSNM